MCLYLLFQGNPNNYNIRMNLLLEEKHLKLLDVGCKNRFQLIPHQSLLIPHLSLLHNHLFKHV